MYWLAPGFDTGKPGFGRRIGRASQECDHHQVAHRLSVWEVRMNPKPISSLEIWHLGNGQGHAVALHAHLDLGANQVEGGVIRRGWGDGDQEQQQAKYGRSHFMAA